MKIGLGLYYYSNYGVDEGCKRMLSHGFTHADYSLASTKTDFYKLEGDALEKFVRNKAEELRSRGIEIVQTHGVWEIPVDIDDATEEGRAVKFAKMARGLLVTKLLGAKYMAIHPLMPFGYNSPENPEEVYKINKEYYSRLAEVAKEYGVTVCIENMPFKSYPLSTCESLMRLVKDVDHENLKFCLDTGHANIFQGSIGDAVRLIGKDYLKIIHVHDNDGSDDQHKIPGDGTIDWDDFTDALREIGFDGVFNAETHPKERDKSDVNIDERECAFAEKILALAKKASIG